MYIEEQLEENDKLNSYPSNLPSIDYKAFADNINKIKSEINSNLSEKDFHHLKKIESWGRLCTLLGYSTAWIIPNPISAFLISQGNITRWLMLTHHISHKGYDKVPNIPARYTSKKYAVGKRRFLDWVDWVLPEAWSYEHNQLHHYYTGETVDPDSVEMSMNDIRNAKIPVFFKYLIILFIMCNWKIIYFTPTTLFHLLKDKKFKNSNDNKSKKIIKGISTFLFKCFLPYFTLRFILLPALFLPLGKTAALFVLINSILAEIMVNIHSFMVVFPSHTGDDVYRFDTGITDQAEFYVRQVTGSVNYNGGNDIKDFFQCWLNYQIEHHLFPDIPMLKYQEFQLKVKEVCKKHNIPYAQESIFKRFFQLINIMTGKTSMKKTSTIPRNLRS